MAGLRRSSAHNKIMDSTIYWFLCSKLLFRPCTVAAEGLRMSALQHRSKRHKLWHPPWQRYNPKIYTRNRSEYPSPQETPQIQKVSFKMHNLPTRQRTNASRCRVRIVATRSSLLVSSDRAEVKIWSKPGLKISQAKWFRNSSRHCTATCRPRLPLHWISSCFRLVMLTKRDSHLQLRRRRRK